MQVPTQKCVFLVIAPTQRLFCSINFITIFLLLSWHSLTEELWRSQIGFPQLIKESLVHLLPPVLLLACSPPYLLVLTPFWIQVFSPSFVIFSVRVQGIRVQGPVFLDSPQCIWICFAIPQVSTLGQRVVPRFSGVLVLAYSSQFIKVQKGHQLVVKYRFYFKLNHINLHLS